MAAPEGTVAALVSPVPSFEFGANQFYGLQLHGDWLYVCAEFNVFGADINLVKRFNVETGSEDVGFTFGLESILPDDSTSGSSSTTPQGIAVNDTRVFISKGGNPEVLAFDHSGNRQSGDDINTGSNTNAIWADNDNLYTLEFSTARFYRYALDGSGRTSISGQSARNDSVIDGLAVDVPNNRIYFTFRGFDPDSILSRTIGDTGSSNNNTTVASLPDNFNARALANVDGVLIAGSQTGTVESRSLSGAEGLYIRGGAAWIAYP